MIAKELSTISSPLVMIGLLWISPALTSLITIGSHALFAAMSALAFWQTLLFYQRKAPRHLWAASIFVAMAALCRSGEGTILFLTFITVATLIKISSMPNQHYSTVFSASVMPFVIIVGAYISFYYVFTGSFDLGMAKYSYGTFEQGQGLAIRDKYPAGRSVWIEGQIEARQLYGTAEENHYSIITAIGRNPKAYLRRVLQFAILVPWSTVYAYGGGLGTGLGIIYFLLATRGAIEMARRRLHVLLYSVLFWPSYVLLYFLLVFSRTNLFLPFFLIFLLVSVGLTAILSHSSNRKEFYRNCSGGLIS
jgi:hypothetical protein